MEKGEKLIEYVVTSISAIYTDPHKAWKELLGAIDSIYVNFRKSQINPEELHVILTEEVNSTGIPTIRSIENIMDVMNRYIKDYKISNATTLFLEFKRLAAIYLFSIGSDKSMDLLKEILSSVEESIGLDSSGDNLDVNMVCLKDCVKLNMAVIHFWKEQFEEAKDLLGDVITTYEVMDNELYLIKMVNFISVAFSFMAWIYTKQKQIDDAEKAFLHAIKVIKIVKRHSKHNRLEEGFVNIKAKKIFIYDQLMNFYALIEKFDQCIQPLNEILKIMDKKNFNYDIDVTPAHHANYYITATLYVIKTENRVDFEKALHYLANVIKIIYKNQELDPIPQLFYENLFILVSCIKINRGKTIFYREIKKNREDKRFPDCPIYENEISDMDKKIMNIINHQINKFSIYLDEIIAKFDAEKTFDLNPSSSNSIIDSTITLDKYSEYIKNIKFSQFNFLNQILINQNDSNNLKKYESHLEINEIYMVKLTTEKMLFTYGNLIKNLNDCKNINEKIIMEGLNGFLVIENDELVLYSIYRFMARDDNFAIYGQIKFQNEEDVREKKSKRDKELETLKVFKIKNLEHNFAPLYYKRITFKLEKDAKTFNFPVYFAVINLLYSKKIYHPCIVLLSIFIDEVSDISLDLYAQEETSQKVNSFLHLYEFLLFFQVYLLMMIRQYDRALFQLIKISKNVNEVNQLLYKTLLGICLSHCYYYDISLMNFSDGIYLIKPLIDMYGTDEDDHNKKNEIERKIIKTPETYLTEIRMFMSLLKCFTYETLNIIYEHKGKICYRCETEDNSINAICLACKAAIYCNKKCMRKNRILHVYLCNFYTENRKTIDSFMENLVENYKVYKEQMQRLEFRRNKDKFLLPHGAK